MNAEAQNTGDVRSDQSPLVSVIMNCYNGAAYLPSALESVVEQTYPHWELIFYDNASTDGSGEIARGYDERVRYFRGDKTIPLGAARNEALARVRGEFIAFLDTDDRWLPEKLECQVAIFNSRPEVDFIYGNAYFLDAASGETTLAYRSRQPEGDVFRSFLRYYPVNLQTVMVRRSGLAAMTEWFDPVFEVSEEYDILMRMLWQCKAAYIHEPLAIYRLHANMSSIRNIDKYPVENQKVLDKLRQQVPDLDLTYRSEVAYLEAKIGYWHAAAAMRRGEPQKARYYLGPQCLKAPEFMALYLATYLPVAVWEWLQILRLKFRPS